jgi:hypothetical protein
MARRRPRKPRARIDHGARLLAVLASNFERTRDQALRKRLQAAIESLRQKREAA